MYRPPGGMGYDPAMIRLTLLFGLAWFAGVAVAADVGRATPKPEPEVAACSAYLADTEQYDAEKYARCIAEVDHMKLRRRWCRSAPDPERCVAEVERMGAWERWLSWHLPQPENAHVKNTWSTLLYRQAVIDLIAVRLADMNLEVPLSAIAPIDQRWEALDSLREIDADAAAYHSKLQQSKSAFGGYTGALYPWAKSGDDPRRDPAGSQND